MCLSLICPGLVSCLCQSETFHKREVYWHTYGDKRGCSVISSFFLGIRSQYLHKLGVVAICMSPGLHSGNSALPPLWNEIEQQPGFTKHQGGGFYSVFTLCRAQGHFVCTAVAYGKQSHCLLNEESSL